MRLRPSPASVLPSVASAAVFVALGHHARDGRIDSWDLRLWRGLDGDGGWQRHSMFYRVVAAASGNGASVVLVAAGLVALGTLFAMNRLALREALFIPGVAVVVTGLTQLFKEAFERPETKYEYPSGHAAASAAVAAAVVVVSASTRWRWPILIVAICLSTALGAALVYRNWHLPSDILGGWSIAIACVLVAHPLVTARKASHFRPGGPALADEGRR